MQKQSKKGFTLVEIMIVVVIIGLLAAMAIPAFKQVRENAINKAMTNDARQLASGAAQYMLENTVTSVTFAIGTDGAITGDLSDYVKTVGKKTVGPTVINQDVTFTMSHPQLPGVTNTYTPEGQPKD